MDHRKIFISFSGDTSKKIALAIKKILEKSIFFRENLCFVSESDITSGTPWFARLKEELATCQLGIVVMTPQNRLEPWICLEAGALIAKDAMVIPLIVEADNGLLKDTPLEGQQAVLLSDKEIFTKMISDINGALRLQEPEDRLTTLSEQAHKVLCRRLKPTLKSIRHMGTSYPPSIFPSKVNAIIKDHIFISAPMASTADETEYQEIRAFLIKLNRVLYDQGYTTVCPALFIENRSKFDGVAQAIQYNFEHLKQAEHIVAVYPRSTASSLLLEIGYSVPLTKQILIFHREELPYMLSEARGYIPHIMTVPFLSYNDIIKYLETNGKAIFNFGP